ncbi:MAG TPA: sulfatase-like hydrolase/transferase [Candidatus Nanoarchaeia archaeon]|nr:sulfatase-like hydrolase/transferase [Candidatus Nanoarchaeia archaeon]
MMKKNVIMILVDGARVDYLKKYPNFSKISNRGTFLSNGCTYAPYTIASLHAIFSGVYGNKSGTDNYYGTYDFNSEDYATLAEYFKYNGFVTYGDTINELVAPKQGFDIFTIHNEFEDNLTERHQAIIKEVKQHSEKKNQPFFLYLHYSNIHTGIKLNVLDKYNNFSQEYFGKTEENKKDYEIYFSKSDEYIGEIINFIENQKLIDDSIVFITNDHGISTGEKIGERAYGVFCYEYTIKTFLICLGEIFPKKEIKNLFRTIDITPTIINIMEFKPMLGYKKMDGKSLLPLINGKDTSQRIAFIQSGNPMKENNPPKKPNVHAIKTDEWKLIFNEANGSYELYKINEDKNEENNLYNNPNYLGIQTELQGLLNKHLQPNITQIDNFQPTKEKNTVNIERSLTELGYWNNAYSKINYFGSGPTKLAYQAADYLVNEDIRKILDLGAGQGRDSLYFSQMGYDVTAIDFSRNAIKSIQEIISHHKTNVKPILYDITKRLPFNDLYFDCVYSNLTFQFLNKQQMNSTISDVHRVLRPGGLFIASIKNHKDKYFIIGNKINNSSTESNGILRYFLDEKETKELIKNFEIIDFYEEKHINLDKSKSCYWVIVARKKTK